MEFVNCVEMKFSVPVSVSGFVVLITFIFAPFSAISQDGGSGLRAGAAATNIDPPKLPVIQNGGFAQRITNTIAASLYARSLVLQNGETTIAICVVDSCMLDRELCDKAKTLIAEKTGIPGNRVLISATHTHTAPSAMRALGTPPDPNYPAFLIPKIAESVATAHRALQPAEAGWTVADAGDFTNTRRWIYLPHKMKTDPYGHVTVRAMMHPRGQRDNIAGPSGPEDPDLTLLSIRTREGKKPLAVFGNLSQHYYARGTLSPGYTGAFCKLLEEEFGPQFVGLMSQGTSGDLQWINYDTNDPNKFLSGEKDHYSAYCRALADLAIAALEKIDYRADCPLAMEEKLLSLERRQPDENRIAWAKTIVETLGEKLPRSRPEVLAKEVFWIMENPETEVKLQALRIGGLGIATLPNEVYALTGLRLKLQSPLEALMVVELANGANGYIPPPEQHLLGGYTTWPALTAGLEIGAEPKMVESLLGAIENIADKKRTIPKEKTGAHGDGIVAQNPKAWWRMSAASGQLIDDHSGHGNHARLEPGYALFLPGPEIEPKSGPNAEGNRYLFSQDLCAADFRSGSKSDPEFASTPRGNRAVHFAGGRMVASKPALNRGSDYTVSLWFWNAMPHDARAVTGYFFSLGEDKNRMVGDHLGISGTAAGPPGRLLFYNGDREKTAIIGKTELKFATWNHVMLVRQGEAVRVYLNGSASPEIEAAVLDTRPGKATNLYIGGRADGLFNFEGKIDEVAVFNSAIEGANTFLSTRLIAALAGSAAQAVHPDSPPVPADQAVKTIHVREGFVVEQVAAEPLTMDPVALDWDEKGQLWVVEMADYPLGIDNDPKKKAGRVRVLTDTDKDGIYDRSSLFLKDLNFPNGIMAWRDGVIITAAPEILFARDNDGDGKADEVKTLFSDLPEGNQQLRINGPRWGLDGWIHLANGWRSQGVVKSEISDHRVEVRGRDLRIRPDTGQIDAVSGPSQFGRVRTDSGDWFGCMNARPIYHYVLPDRYLKRNANTAFPKPYIELYTESEKAIFPAKKPEKRYHSFHQSGRFTSACGPGFYRDGLFFEDDFDHYFICEPFHNLVHHSMVSADRFTYSAERDGNSEGDREFFASDDRWCRPVMARTGPDGALWVVDMYRYLIEHPQFLPAHGKTELEKHYRLGKDQGRIYRIFPEGKRPDSWATLADQIGGDPFELLKSRNGIQRDLGHRILSQRRIGNEISKLRALAGDKSVSSLTKLHALHLLGEFEGLQPEDLKGALASDYFALRRAVPKLAETLKLSEPSVREGIAALDSDADPRVTFQLVLSLGEAPAKISAPLLAKFFRKHESDPYWQAALFSSVNPENLFELLAHLSGQRDGEIASPEIAGELCRLALQQENQPATKLALDLVSGSTDADQTGEVWRFEVLAAMYPVLNQSQLDLVRELADRAPQVAADATAVTELRAAAVSLLRPKHLSILVSLLEEQHPPSVRDRAAKQLRNVNRPETASSLIDSWPRLDNSVRKRVLGLLLSRPAWSIQLLRALEKKEIELSVFDAASREQFARVLPANQRDRLAKVLGSKNPAGSPRSEVVARYSSALKAGSGDSGKGRAVFRASCVACHRLEDSGVNLGPDLLTLTDRSRKSLLDSILDPSSNVDPRYRIYVASTTDAQVISGFLESESDADVVIRQPDNLTVRIARSKLRRLSATEDSLMPAGLEASITVESMADLLSYLEEVLPSP